MTVRRNRSIPHLLWLLLLFLSITFAGKANAQVVTTPASDVNRIVYVANAIDHLQNSLAPEKVALAVFIVKMYSLDADAQFFPNPSPNYNSNANPGTVVRWMVQAQEKYDIQYRSRTTPRKPRFPLLAHDALSTMMGFLAVQPGSPISGTMAAEAINFQTAVGYRVGNPQTRYLDQSNFLGSSRVTGGFYNYRNRFLEKMFDLAQINPRAATAVDTFFGQLFNASVRDTARQVLDKNTALRDSQNFAPFVTLIRPDGSIQVTEAQFNTVAMNFQNRMAAVTTQSMNGLAEITNLQKANYAATYLNPTSPDATAIRLKTQTVMNVVAPMLQGAGAVSYALPFTIEPDPNYTAYQQTVAGLAVGEATARLAANVVRVAGYGAAAAVGFATPGSAADGAIAAVEAAAAAIDVVGDGLALTAATMDLAASFGAFGPSDEEVIMNGINMLSSQLNQVQVQLNNRFDIIDAKIDTLYTVMNNQFSAVKGLLVNQGVLLSQIQLQVSALQNQVNAVQADVFRLSESIFDFANTQYRQTLNTTLVNIDTHVRNATPITSDQYQNLYAVVLNHALSGSSDSQEISSVASRGYSDVDLVREFSIGPFPEWNINYMLEFLERKWGLVLRPGGSNIANPRAWAMSVTGMMRLASADPQYFLVTTANDKSSDGSGFFGARNVGRAIQTTVANCTVIYNPTTFRFERSPLFELLLQFQQQKATALDAALIALETDPEASPALTTLASKVAHIKAQWNISMPTARGAALQTAWKELDGSRRLLEQFTQFGLSRSLTRDEFLRSALYSPQRLPDSLVVYNPAETNAATAKSLYAKWQSNAPNPRLTFETAQSQRWTALSDVIITTLNVLVADTTALNANGEPLAEVDDLLQRFGYYTLTRVSGHVQPAANNGGFIPGEPMYVTFRSRTGSQVPFLLPVLLDAGGNFTVFVPEDNYDVRIKADRYLAKTVFIVNTLLGNVTLASGKINVSLLTGDVTGDNVVNNSDQIAVRNAWGQARFDPRWNPAVDINHDNSVDINDLLLLVAAYNSTAASLNWNPAADATADGRVDINDLLLLIAAYNSSGDVNPAFDILCDLNNDNMINNADMLLLRANLGKHGDQ